MKDRSEQLFAETPETEGSHLGLVGQIATILHALKASNVGKALIVLVISIFLVIVLTAYGQIRLNLWNKRF